MSLLLHVFKKIYLEVYEAFATCQPYISQHCWAQYVARVWPPYCDVLRHVLCFWLMFEKGQI